MSTTKDPFTFLKTRSESHMGLAGQLIGVNIDCMEKMVSSQFLSIKELVDKSASFPLDDHSQTSTWWLGIGISSFEYWKEATLGGLELQHRILQTLVRHSSK